MFDTTDYVARDENGNVTSTVRVHEVTDADIPRNEAGNKVPLRVQTTGGDQEVREGQLLVQGQNPNYWDVFDADTFDGLGYAQPQDAPAPTVQEPATQAPTQDPTNPAQDPTDPNALHEPGA